MAITRYKKTKKAVKTFQKNSNSKKLTKTGKRIVRKKIGSITLGTAKKNVKKVVNQDISKLSIAFSKTPIGSINSLIEKVQLTGTIKVSELMAVSSLNIGMVKTINDILNGNLNLKQVAKNILSALVTYVTIKFTLGAATKLGVSLGNSAADGLIGGLDQEQAKNVEFANLNQVIFGFKSSWIDSVVFIEQTNNMLISFKSGKTNGKIPVSINGVTREVFDAQVTSPSPGLHYLVNHSRDPRYGGGRFLESGVIKLTAFGEF